MISGEYKDVVEKDKCGQEAWEALFTMPAWEEFLDTLQIRLALTRDELEREEVAEEVNRLQGDARSLRYILALPSIIKSEFEAQRSDKERKDG